MFKKKIGFAINFSCILLFFEFLLYFLVFYCFLAVNYRISFFSHKYTQINLYWWFLVKIMLFMWIYWTNRIYIGFVHKIMFLSNIGFDKFFSNERGFKTVRASTPNLKEKIHETARREHLALRTYRAKCLGGRIPPRPF